MSKTYELRKIVYSLLKQSEGEAYYKKALKTASFPYKVFSFGNIDLGDIDRDNLILVVDVWSKNEDKTDEVSDAIENDLNCVTAPQDNSYPTFYKVSRSQVEDEDESLHHNQLKFQIHNYYIGE